MRYKDIIKRLTTLDSTLATATSEVEEIKRVMAKDELGAYALAADAFLICAAEWFEDARMQHWLHDPKTNAATWSKDGELGDIFFTVEPCLSGNGSDMDFPFWDQLIQILRDYYGNSEPKIWGPALTIRLTR